MSVPRLLLSALATALVALSCASHTPAAEPREPAPPFARADFRAALEDDAESFTIVKGQWVESLGDAPFYGLGFYAHAAPGSPREAAWTARAQAARAYDVSLLATADFFNGDLQQMVMSALGVIDYIDATGDRSDLAALDAFLDRFDNLVKLIGWYIDSGADKSWALSTYGPTSISALVGLVNAQYALLVRGDRADDRKAWAVEMATHIDEHAWNGHAYEFGAPNHETPSLYPNVAMIALQARLFELTHDDAHRARAVAVFDALAPLRQNDALYYSEYSAASFGAKTRDFATLSSQNYLMLSLDLLYEITGRAKYVVESDAVLDAVAQKMSGQWCLHDVHAEACASGCTAPQLCVTDACRDDACHGGVLHHWIDGRPAKPSDPTFFCSGCNLQLLYVLWYRQTKLAALR